MGEHKGGGGEMARRGPREQQGGKRVGMVEGETGKKRNEQGDEKNKKKKLFNECPEDLCRGVGK